MLKNRFMMIFLCLSISGLSVARTPAIESPEQHFGFVPGSDRMLFDYEQLIRYLQKLDAASPRLKMIDIGRSPMGRTMYIAAISSEENIGSLDRLKSFNRRLALDDRLSGAEIDDILTHGRVFVLGTLSMHSSEVGPTQASPLIAHQLLTTTDPIMLKWLDDVVYLMVPCHNPDGMDMIVDHYRSYKGTKYETSAMPGIYHRYVGHDNNRDFVTLTQSDTRAIARISNLDFFPQVMVEKHQMGSTSARYFVPPSHDPIAENVDARLWNWIGIFGSNLITDMTQQGLSGVSQHYLFDDYWPGSTTTGIWKNAIGLLTEAASVRHATPIYIEPNELKGYGKGLSEYKKSINMPLPWPGGWWRLSDLMNYEIVSTMSILKTASLYRSDILRFQHTLCRDEVKKGYGHYYVLPMKQHDPGELVDLINLLREHGVRVYQLTAATEINEHRLMAGDVAVPLAQPFRAFIKEVLETQSYPVRHYTPNGEIIKPYDITSWSLPLHRGIHAISIDRPDAELNEFLTEITENFRIQEKIPETYGAAIFTINHNESYKIAFRAVRNGLRVHRLKNAMRLKESEIPANSFIIDHADGLRTLIDELNVPPSYVEQKMDIATNPFRIPRIALVESYFHDMDAGWTRYLFDSYSLPYRVIRPGDFKRIDFTDEFDVVIFPDEDEKVLLTGKFASEDEDDYDLSNYPPEYTEGIGEEGMDRLLRFLDRGGRIVSWGHSTRLFMKNLSIKISKDEKEEFQLPVKDISKSLMKAGLYCPGSFLRIVLTAGHPLTQGMPRETGGFARGEPVFATSIPSMDTDRRVIGRFPEENILLSGYCEKEEKLGDTCAIVWLKKGKGQLVCFAFQPQFRASTPATYKLLFNAILVHE